jgi:hypothetical protein
MVVIQAEVNGVESDFLFSVPESRTAGIDKYKWDGFSKDFPSEQITLLEKGGDLDFTTLTTSSGVTTSHEILYERIKEALNNYRDSIRAGYEPEDDTERVSTEPTPYDPEKIKVRRDTFSIYQVFDMMDKKNGDIDLNPEFQRNFVWDNARKSLLIESILLGIPIPVLYFAENKSGEYHVVDGMQRLTTIKQYLNNEFALKNLEYLKECEGMYYKKTDRIKDSKVLNRKYSRRIEQAQLNINIIEASSPSDVKYDIFKRLNTGGRPLNNQEIRNCLAVQGVRNFLREMALSTEFKNATGGGISDIRMDAQEMVLRFSGFYLARVNNRMTYPGEMNPFLDQTMDKLNEMTKKELDDISKAFTNSMNICYHLFGKYCFRKCLSEHLLPNSKKQLINKSLFITWAIEVLNFKEPVLKKKINYEEMAEILAKEFDKKGEYYSVVTINTSSIKSLDVAFSYAKKILKQKIKND